MSMADLNNTLEVLADELVEAARLLHNLTLGDTTVIVQAPTAEKRDAIAGAGKRLRDAIQAARAALSAGSQGVALKFPVVTDPKQLAHIKECFQRVKAEVGTKGWVEMDFCNYMGFFMWGFEAARQSYAVPPAGWQLVPIEPTKEMLDAVVTTVDEAVHGKNAEVQYREDWIAMLIAAPAHPRIRKDEP
jgi:hypothetical protein